jgi:hypothetical protein
VTEEDVEFFKIERNAKQWATSLMPSVLWSEVCDCGRGGSCASFMYYFEYYYISTYQALVFLKNQMKKYN